MSIKIRILIAEHDPVDLELIHFELELGGINYISETVQNEQEYINALKVFIPDIILCEYTFPFFDGLTAFKIKERIVAGTPFIFVSGIIDEERSNELIENGVTDCVLKDKLFTLATKVKRALKESKEKKEKDKTSRALKNVLSDLNKIMDSSLDVICTIDEKGRFVIISAASERIWGYKPSELIGRQFMDLVFHEDVEKTRNMDAKIMSGVPATFFENRYVHKNGSIVPILWSARWDDYDKLIYCVAKDITEKQEVEKAILSERRRYADLFMKATAFICILKGPKHIYQMANSDYEKMIGKKDFIGKPVRQVLPEVEGQGFFEKLDAVYETGETFIGNEMSIKLVYEGKLTECYINFSYQAYRNIKNEIEGIFVFGTDVTEQLLSHKKIEKSEKEYRQIVETAQEGIWMIDENNKTTFVNKKMCEILEYPEEEMMGRTNLSFKDEKEQEKTLQSIERRKKGIKEIYETRFITKSGRNIWTHVSANPILGEDGYYRGALAMMTDITERKLSEIRLSELNEDLQKQTKELAISNAELEQFAYVASHDLQEPLRMVTSYLTQIEKKYANVIDDKGREYIHFAVDGAKRMRQIILDILEFSRVGRTENSIENIDLNKVIHEIQVLFRKQIAEKKAVFVVDKLPQVNSHISPMRQVFQNLIGNALKYTRENIPLQIRITVTELKNLWQFSIADNGIGIEKEYFDKIFIIFQRLHNKDEFSGTGMGLAVTKKIIETQGGKIWVESEKGKGTTFYFTLLKQ